MKATTQDWLNYAETDLLTCTEILNNKHLTNIVIFHAQQTVEKCFKAIIEENNIKVPRIGKPSHNEAEQMYEFAKQIYSNTIKMLADTKK